MAAVEAPCKDCQDRAVGCHITCDRYLSFRQAKAELEKAKAEGREISSYVGQIKRRKATVMSIVAKRRLYQ